MTCKIGYRKKRDCLVAVFFVITVIDFYANARAVSVRVQSQLATRRTAGVFRVAAVFVAPRLRWFAAAAVFRRSANGIYIGLFVQKSSVIAASHTKFYVADIKFVKMLENLIKV